VCWQSHQSLYALVCLTDATDGERPLQMLHCCITVNLDEWMNAEGMPNNQVLVPEMLKLKLRNLVVRNVVAYDDVFEDGVKVCLADVRVVAENVAA
jgi:hypothetical protein